eukprot:scaffold93656_cov22-Tisochrysis_lutea.AAC.1
MPPGSTLAHSRDALCTTHAFQSNVTGKAQVEASWHGTSPLVPACAAPKQLYHALAEQVLYIAHSASINRLHSERSNSVHELMETDSWCMCSYKRGCKNHTCRHACIHVSRNTTHTPASASAAALTGRAVAQGSLLASQATSRHTCT